MPDENLHGVQVPRYEAEPTLVLRAGPDFEVRTVVVDPQVPEARRLEADVDIPLAVEQDTWVVVLVKGTDGVSRPIWPMNPQDLVEEGNATLDDLTDGNLGEGGNPALAFSNPLFIDVDGNGRFDAPEAEAMRAHRATSLAERGRDRRGSAFRARRDCSRASAPVLGFFALLDDAPLVVTATVAERIENAAPGIVVYELAVQAGLKGAAASTESARGAGSAFSIRPARPRRRRVSGSSRSNLCRRRRATAFCRRTRPIFTSATDATRVRSAEATPAVQPYLAAAARPPAQRRRERIGALIAALSSPLVGGDALSGACGRSLAGARPQRGCSRGISRRRSAIGRCRSSGGAPCSI